MPNVESAQHAHDETVYLEACSQGRMRISLGGSFLFLRSP